PVSRPTAPHFDGRRSNEFARHHSLWTQQREGVGHRPHYLDPIHPRSPGSWAESAHHRGDARRAALLVAKCPPTATDGRFPGLGPPSAAARQVTIARVG